MRFVFVSNFIPVTKGSKENRLGALTSSEGANAKIQSTNRLTIIERTFKHKIKSSKFYIIYFIISPDIAYQYKRQKC